MNRDENVAIARHLAAIQHRVREAMIRGEHRSFAGITFTVALASCAMTPAHAPPLIVIAE
jgi:hypothetical protein